MITFNQKDDHLAEIFQQAGFQDLNTKYDYYIFGLKDNQDSHLYISYVYGDYPELLYTNWFYLRYWLSNNKLRFLQDIGDPPNKLPKKEHICIGLRKDLRENIKFSSCLLKSIIFVLEEKIKLKNSDTKEKIPNMPKFH